MILQLLFQNTEFIFLSNQRNIQINVCLQAVEESTYTLDFSPFSPHKYWVGQKVQKLNEPNHIEPSFEYHFHFHFSLPANAGDEGLIPELGRSPGEGNGNSLLYSCLGNPMDRRAWRATDHVVTESDTTE